MPYTDLSYYKLSVHLQICLAPERLQALHRVPEPLSLLSQTKFRFPVFSERQTSSSDCCRRVHMRDKAEGKRRSPNLGRGTPGLSWRWDGRGMRDAVFPSHSVVVQVESGGVGLPLQR